MRRRVLTVLIALVVVLGLGTAVVAASGTGSSVTRPRLERSLPVTFANLYADQARLEGRTGVTPASLHAKAMCDKAGAANVDTGPGGDWVCLMSWTDPEVPMPAEGYGKFELNVHSNDCWTAAGPSKLTGFLTMTDAAGATITNPVFEFDGCFDPEGNDSPTGVEFPSLLAVTSTTVTPDADGRVGVQVTCGSGSEGCAGTITATATAENTAGAGDTPLGTTTYDVSEESTATLALPDPVPSGAATVSFSVSTTTGVGPSSPVTLPVQ